MVDSIHRIASALDTAKVITREAAAVATSKLGESSYTYYSQNINPQQLVTLLNSRNSREVRDAMKRIISIMASDDDSIDVQIYFADVVKNITTNDTKVKRLIHLYLLRFAENDPNLTLLSINSLQKSLSDSNSELRCFALSALSDMKMSSLAPIILHTVKKLVTDPSAMVRGEVALAIIKLYRAGKNDYHEELLDILKELMADTDPKVISCAVLAYKECYADHLELLHGHFRRYCRIIKQLDSWSQSYLIELLIKYCKQYLPKPTVVDKSSEGSPRSCPLPDKYNEIEYPSYEVVNDPDLDLFLQSLNCLIYSSNPTVILSCCNALYQLASPLQMKNTKFIEALVRTVTMTENQGNKEMLLQAIHFLSILDQTLFLPYTKKFYVFPKDPIVASIWKIQILSTLINESNVKEIFKELKYYVASAHFPENVVIMAVKSLSRCGQLSTSWESHVMKWLIDHMESHNLSASVLDAYVNVIRMLVQKNPTKHLRIIFKLADLLTVQTSLADNARAGIVWLFGEIASIEFKICPDVLRRLIQNFSNEGPETRCQILVLSAKLLSYDIDNFKQAQVTGSEENNQNPSYYDFSGSRISQMYNAVLYLAKYDDEFDIRDRARMISSLFDSGKYEIVSLLLQAPKPTARSDDFIVSARLETHTPEIKEFFRMLPWNTEITEVGETGNDIREGAELKDYNKYKKSFSSQSFITNNSARSFTSSSNAKLTGINDGDSNSISGKGNVNTFTSQNGKKYRLQSLDEFFSDIPERKSKPRKIIKVVEESSDEDEDESEESSDDDEYSDSSLGTSSSGTSSSHLEL
ncbi:ANM_HP_G0029880.mRNA.1.CDS.1 [Saccharomyces cerevisiae]|nr:ANM_HP_G0204190.mRNA.1.CDS.1 [Saccharomyces cerevisiae]CAI5172215.1 ANM_HP_G0239320.mRNA.1.CDS.1 [Saccharomyces cerevisiae]CAI5218793.1 ANM_HP_G0029880.mRNA.1.CDS.1 [Saccharomyces cerevisiae]CAI6696503.1 ANM_collapsed_G0022750.mRNA.1.CDS.1 [Saccharomyces cerevisiae]CAI6964008.1 ANM_HP_G0204190.mRNA.1.CDS.1 [Saccharomyces cerevisiae]